MRGALPRITLQPLRNSRRHERSFESLPNGESAIAISQLAGLRAAYRQNEKSVETEHTIVSTRPGPTRFPHWLGAGSHSGFTIPSMHAGAGSSAVGSHGTRTESADDSWPVSTWCQW
jgi:hypothetical protein